MNYVAIPNYVNCNHHSADQSAVVFTLASSIQLLVPGAFLLANSLATTTYTGPGGCQTNKTLVWFTITTVSVILDVINFGSVP